MTGDNSSPTICAVWFRLYRSVLETVPREEIVNFTSAGLIMAIDGQMLLLAPFHPSKETYVKLSLHRAENVNALVLSSLAKHLFGTCNFIRCLFHAPLLF